MLTPNPAAAVTARIVGESRCRLFGLTSEEYLRRHLRSHRKGATDERVLVAAADVVVAEAGLAWLTANDGHVLTDADGRPLIGVTSRAQSDVLAAAIAGDGPLPSFFVPVKSGAVDIFVRKLRRREPVEALDLRQGPPSAVERRLFDLVYKGVTDLVTRYAWPRPAFHVVRLLAALGVAPNMVTLTGMILVVVASLMFAEGLWAGALLAAWVMTFLDTVDGKLARVTATSSKLGDILDHGTDWIHPPAWWVCVALGLTQGGSMLSEGLIWACCAVILGCYVAGRASEAVFKSSFGFNQYLWSPFDSALRMVIARRNVNLLILPAGVVVGAVDIAFAVLALWSIMSVGAQVVRFGQAWVLRRSGGVVDNWLA